MPSSGSAEKRPADTGSAATGSGRGRPPTTLEGALGWAAAVRGARGDLVAAVGAGLDATGVTSATVAFPEVGDTYVVVVVQAVPGLGKIGARRRLAALGIDEFAAISSLTPAVLGELLVPGDRAIPNDGPTT